MRTVGTRVWQTSKLITRYGWQRLSNRARRMSLHLIISIADHFEPAIVPGDGAARASYDEQQRRLESWCKKYPAVMGDFRDSDGHPFSHTYFYPAEQYDRGLMERLARHCSEGWGEIEIHLHHGIKFPDTAANTRRQLLEFRNILAEQYKSLCYLDGVGAPRYGFVHGNFALANSAKGMYCGVDEEIEVLAETGCYGDFTLPAASFHPAQIGKINSLYECSLPLDRQAAHRRGRDLVVGTRPEIFPLMVQGPLLPDFNPGGHRRIRIENAALSGGNPPTMHRLELWKRAAIAVRGRPGWLFIKLHCHSMDPTQEDAVLGPPMQRFLRELVEGAPGRQETLHFVSAREMVNIILAACDGREGSPGQYRDYRLKKLSKASTGRSPEKSPPAMVKG